MKLPSDLKVLLSIAMLGCVLLAAVVSAIFWVGQHETSGATASGGDSFERGCGVIFLSTYGKTRGDLSQREADEAAVCSASGNYHAPDSAAPLSRKQPERNRRDVQELNSEIHHWPVAPKASDRAETHSGAMRPQSESWRDAWRATRAAALVLAIVLGVLLAGLYAELHPSPAATPLTKEETERHYCRYLYNDVKASDLTGAESDRVALWEYEGFYHQ